MYEKLLLTRLPTGATPKSPLKRGTLIKFSPLNKGGWGRSDTFGYFSDILSESPVRLAVLLTSVF